ncbi:MAG: type 4a pilus biogenesis protein PilO [Candidatus Moduliflexus flocculans]|nr:type 4a pilus biogenesis protein PilO [Candidatus Moduliflexus flocculans]
MVILLIGYFDWFYFLSSAIEKRTSLNEKLDRDCRGKLKTKEKLPSRLINTKLTLRLLKENYKTALQKLPDQREIPGLFHSVALAGHDAGIDFLLFEPKAVLKAAPAKGDSKAVAALKPSDQRQTDPKKAADSKSR